MKTKPEILSLLDTIKSVHWASARRLRDQADRSKIVGEIERLGRRVRQEMKCVDDLNEIIDWVRARKTGKITAPSETDMEDQS